MKAAERFRGAGTALVTPFNEDGSLDEASFRRLVDWQIEEGIDFLVPCGTTGENPALSFEEHIRVIELTIEAANGRVPVLAGAGSNSTDKAIEFAIESVALGADGILTITPYYNKPGPSGLLRHFSAQAEAIEKKKSGVPLILYNVPSRTGLNMKPETTLMLAEKIPTIAGVKEASGDLQQILTILHDRDDGFIVLSGDDAWTLPILAAGADGVVSVASNEVPRQMAEMVRHAHANDFASARKIHDQLLELMLVNFIETNPAPAKSALAMMGIISGDAVRSPLAGISDASRDAIRKALENAGVMKGESP